MTRAAVVLLMLAVAGCSAPRLTPADAEKMIETHPRFSAPDIYRVPARYCATDVANPAPNPGQGVNRLKLMEDEKILTLTPRAAAAGECDSPAYHAIVDVKLTDIAATFHPTPLPENRGWEFIVAHRRFVKIDNITYDNDDDPKLAHVQYAWAWRPELLGQLLEMGSVVQGASATFLRNGDGWIVRQPGM